MNPLTNVRNIKALNEREVKLGINENNSWHQEYKNSAWIFVGGLPYTLTEGDVLCVFSQYGEVVNINLIRDKKTGRPKGYAFLCYEDQRSTILAVDNLNGIKLTGRTIRVDHVANYRIPKDHPDIDEVTKVLRAEGCAPKVDSKQGSVEKEVMETEVVRKNKHKKKRKKEKSKKTKAKKKRRHDSSSSSTASTLSTDSSSDSENDENPKRPQSAAVVIKQEKKDDGFSKYEIVHQERKMAEKRKNSSKNEISEKLKDLKKHLEETHYKSDSEFSDQEHNKHPSKNKTSSSDSPHRQNEKQQMNKIHKDRNYYESNYKHKHKKHKSAQKEIVNSTDSSDDEREQQRTSHKNLRNDRSYSSYDSERPDKNINRYQRGKHDNKKLRDEYYSDKYSEKHARHSSATKSFDHHRRH